MTDQIRPSRSNRTLSRREMLRRGAAVGAGITALGASSRAAAATGAAPFNIVRAKTQGSAGTVIVRTPGGAYEEAMRKAVYEPFTAETGIEVQTLATNAAQIVAMVESGNVTLDVLDMGEIQMLTLIGMEAVEPLDRTKFTLTNLEDVDPVHEHYTGNNVYSTILAYNTEEFPDRHPTSWAEFWDTEAFPGPRMLADAAAAKPDIEFALMADGVAMEELYPLDVDRAFTKLSEIRGSILKWWDSGAVSAQMLADRQVVLGSAWNGRVQTVADAGAPVAIEWNQAERFVQVFGLLKGAPNLENGYKLIDFALQPGPQAEFARIIGYGPVNKTAFASIDEPTAAKLPTSPEHAAVSFASNSQWWFENREEVNQRWQEFLLGG